MKPSTIARITLELVVADPDDADLTVTAGAVGLLVTDLVDAVETNSDSHGLRVSTATLSWRPAR